MARAGQLFRLDRVVRESENPPERLPDALIEHVEGLPVSQGVGAGEMLALFDWERQFIEGAFRPHVYEAALSVGRGNGKTTLLAAVAHAAINGPLARARGEVVVVASSFEQARLTFDHVLAFQYWPKTRFRVWDSKNAARIEDLRTGARLRVLGSDPARLHGLAPVLVLADEPAQWPRNQAERMAAALRTAMGKIEGARFVALGTRAAEGDHFFERMLDPDGGRYAQCHAAPANADPLDPATWAMANPSLPYMPALRNAIRSESAVAERDAVAMAAFRALRLNMGVPDTIASHLLDPDVWQQYCEGEALPRGEYVLGIDLGGSSAMSAAAAYWPASYALRVLAAFPTLPGFIERGRTDGVGDIYSRMAERGELLALGERVVAVPEFLAAVLDRYGRPAAIVADRWRAAELRQALDAAGFPPTALVLRGMGFKDGAEDVRRFRQAALGGFVQAHVSLLLRSAIAEARVTADPAGNWKLAKGGAAGRRVNARDDAAAAAILAVAEARRSWRQTSSGRCAVML